jgi:hypothetical protein
MLAAVPSDESKVLELFNLALQIVRDRGAIPSALSEHFNSVLSQAKSLAVDPASVSGGITPQAIQLACRLRQTTELRREIDNVPNISAITPDVASKILASLGERVAP